MTIGKKKKKKNLLLLILVFKIFQDLMVWLMTFGYWFGNIDILTILLARSYKRFRSAVMQTNTFKTTVYLKIETKKDWGMNTQKQ